MPIGAAAATLGAAGISSGLSALSTAWQNRKSQKWSDKRYEKERADNLEDWNRQNAYNTPEQQIQRMKDAKLNPALMYGSGSAGGGTASPLKSPDHKNPQFQSTDFSGVAQGAQNAINQHYDTRIKQAQTDNLKAQNTVLTQEALLKSAQVQNTGVKTKQSELDLQNAKQYSGDAARLANRNTEVQIEATTSDTDRKNALQGSNMEQAAINVVRGRIGKDIDKAKLQSILKDIDLKAYELKLQKMGINKNDPLWMRLIIQNAELIMEQLGGKPVRK